MYKHVNLAIIIVIVKNDAGLEPSLTKKNPGEPYFYDFPGFYSVRCRVICLPISCMIRDGV